MSYTNAPSTNIIDRVRLITGDTDIDDEGYGDEVYQFALDRYVGNSNAETLAALDVLKMLVAKYATYTTEKAGGLFQKGSEKYQQYKDLLDMLTKDPTTSIIKAGAGFTGGISIYARDTNRNNPDRRANPFSFSDGVFNCRFYD